MELTYAGQDVKVTTENVQVDNEPNAFEIHKTDAVTGEPLEGVTFMVWDKDDVAADESDENAIVGEEGEGVVGQVVSSDVPQPIEGEDLVEADTPEDETIDTGLEVVTDAEGLIRLEALEPGTYHFMETATLDGYFISEEVGSFTVAEDSTIEGGVNHRVDVTNDYTKVLVSKTDITGDEELVGAHLEIRDSEGEIVAEWVSTEEQHLIERLEPGDYTLIETIAPEGFRIAHDVEFTVEPTGEIQKVHMVDEYAPRIETQAHDKLDGDKLITARENVTIVDTVSYEHLIVGETYRIEGILMDKATGEALLVNGNEVRSEAEFVAETATGTIELEFSFDGRGLINGQRIVVFEELYENIDGEFVLVAEHKDINDAAQTVTVVPDVIEELPKMGDGSLAPYVVLLTQGLVIVFCVSVLGLRHLSSRT